MRDRCSARHCKNLVVSLPNRPSTEMQRGVNKALLSSQAVQYLFFFSLSAVVRTCGGFGDDKTGRQCQLHECQTTPQSCGVQTPLTARSVIRAGVLIVASLTMGSLTTCPQATSAKCVPDFTRPPLRHDRVWDRSKGAPQPHS